MAALFKRRGPLKAQRKARTASESSSEEDTAVTAAASASVASDSSITLSTSSQTDVPSSSDGAVYTAASALPSIATVPPNGPSAIVLEGGNASSGRRNPSTTWRPPLEALPDDDAAFIVRKSKASKALSRSKAQQRPDSGIDEVHEVSVRAAAVPPAGKPLGHLQETAKGPRMEESTKYKSDMEGQPVFTSAAPGLTVTLKTTHAVSRKVSEGSLDDTLKDEATGRMGSGMLQSAKSIDLQIGDASCGKSRTNSKHKHKSSKTVVVTVLDEAEEDATSTQQLVQLARQQRERARASSLGHFRLVEKDSVGSSFTLPYSSLPAEGMNEFDATDEALAGPIEDVSNPVERLKRQLDQKTFSVTPLSQSVKEKDEDTEEMEKWEWEQYHKGTGNIRKPGVAATAQEQNGFLGAQANYELADIARALNDLSSSEEQVVVPSVNDTRLSYATPVPTAAGGGRSYREVYQNDLDRVFQNFKDELQHLEDLRKENMEQVDTSTHQTADAADKMTKLDMKQKDLEKKLKEMDAFASFVGALSGFLAAKTEPIAKASKTLVSMEQDLWENIWGRKIQDAQDLYSDASLSRATYETEDFDEFGRSKAYALSLTIDERSRRREKRRQKRLSIARKTESVSNEFEVGYVTSADDSDIESLKKAIYADRMQFNAAALRIMKDAHSDYCDIGRVVDTLLLYRKECTLEFNKAFDLKSLIELFWPFVEWHTLWWDPLYLTTVSNEYRSANISAAPMDTVRDGKKQEVEHSPTLEVFDWYQAILKFVMEDTLEEDTEVTDAGFSNFADDPISSEGGKTREGHLQPDEGIVRGDLLIALAQKIVFERVKQWIKLWDMTSLRYSERLSLVMNEMLIFRENASLNAVKELLEALVARMKEGIDSVLCCNDPSKLSDVVRKEYLWRATKVARCILQFQEVLNEQTLMQYVLKLIYERRMYPMIDSRSIDDFIVLEKFVGNIPIAWLVNGCPLALQSAATLVKRFQKCNALQQSVDSRCVAIDQRCATLLQRLHIV